MAVGRGKQVKRGNRRCLISFELIALVGVFVCAPLEASAALVWSETFDELDSEVWTTLLSCKLEDGALRGFYGDHISAVRAYHPSNISVGTWKFDLTEFDEFNGELDDCKVYFISPGLPTSSEYYAFSLTHAASAEGMAYSFSLEKYTYDAPHVALDTCVGETRPEMYGVLHHFAITRTSDGHMSVYMNSTLILDAIDTDLNSTEYFGFYTWDDWAFDNVAVYETIEMGGDYTPMLIGVASVAAVAIIALVFWRRK